MTRPRSWKNGEPGDHGRHLERRGIVTEVVPNDLFDVGDHVLMRNHHTRRGPGRSGGVLQVGRSGMGMVGVVQISRVTSTSIRSTSMTAGAGRPPCGRAYLLTSATTADVVRTTLGALSLQHGGHPLIVGAELRHRQRHRDEAGLHRPRRRRRCSRGPGARGWPPDHRLTRIGATPRRGQHPAMQLGPRQALRVARAEHSGVHERVGDGVALRGGLVAEGVRESTSRRSPYGVTSSRFLDVRHRALGTLVALSGDQRTRPNRRTVHSTAGSGAVSSDPGTMRGLWLIYQLRKPLFELRRPTAPARAAQAYEAGLPSTLSARGELSPVMALCWPFTS